MPSIRPPIYQGYIGWPDGLSIWPSTRRTRIWQDIEWIHTYFVPDNRTVRTTIRFRSGKTTTLGASRDFSWTKGRGRFAEVVALAVAAAPKEAKINEDTIEVALWGSRASRRAALQPAASRPDADALVRRARHHRVWMEIPKALSLIKVALQQQPAHAEALRMRCQLYWQFGRPKEARRAAQEWLAVRPGDTEARSYLFQIELALNNPGVVENAREVLARAPDNPALAAALADYLFRRGEFEEAATFWDRLGAAALEPEVRSFAAERAIYARRYGADTRFRRREKAKALRRPALIIAVALVPLVLVAGLQVLRWKEHRELKKRIAEIRKEIDTDTERRHLEFTELTGRIIGSPEEVRARAEKGEAAAQLTFGEMLLQGDRVEKDVPAGLGYLERAAAQDHRASLVTLADQYRRGEIVEKDMTRAAELLRRAADLGSPRAAADLGEMYFKGDGVAVDKAAAFALFVRGAEGGNLFSMERAGWALERGEGVERDIGRAIEYYRRAAEKDDKWAIERLIQLLMRQEGQSADHNEAWTWVRKGAELGSVQSRVTFASFVLRGIKTDAESGANALPWLVESAEGGSSHAQGMLGSCYMNGWGVTQDFGKAVEWLAKSEPANEKSRAILSLCHAFGIGVKRDLNKAVELRSRVGIRSEQEWLDRYLEAATRVVEPSTRPVPVFQDQPRYPFGLAREGIEGRVFVRFVVDRDGFVLDAHVGESTRSEFEAPALVAISCWRFAPLEGKDSVKMEIPISFKLNKESKNAQESEP